MSGTTLALMCPPEYFAVDYSINPWMNTDVGVDQKRAREQWKAVRDTLTAMGVPVSEVNPEPGLPDMVFAGDCGLAVGNRFLVSNFRHPEREPEARHYARWFESRGYQLVWLPDDVHFEGLGDIVWWGHEAVFGHGLRSSASALPHLRAAFPDLVVHCELELVDPRFYHAGLAIAYVGQGRAIYYPGAFSAGSRDALVASIPELYAVDEEDAMVHFACNNLVVRNSVLMAGCSQHLEDQLARWELEVVRLEMGEFKKSGASLRCLVLDL